MINLEYFLQEDLGPGTAGTDSPNVNGSVPMVQPSAPPSATAPIDPNIANMPQGQPPSQPPADVSKDPQSPDMPEEKESKNFEGWKKDFFTESIKGDVQKMKEMLLEVRDRDLDEYQDKFVNDNLQIIFVRENANIDKAEKEIRKLIKTQTDHNNPATSVANHITSVLQTVPQLNSIFIKLTGLGGMKADPHRKFIAALTGGVQVGNGGKNEDIIIAEKDFYIRLSTRLNSRFGEVHIGEWCLKEDDPERYLQAPELQRLKDGSPEEKDVLRRRIVMESIAEAFKTRSFFINVVGVDGTIYTVGWDIATCLKAAYTEGRLVVRNKNDDSSMAMIDDDGEVIPFIDKKIMFVKNTGEMDEHGKPLKKEIEFMSEKYGQLYLVAPLVTLREASTAFQGLVFKETPWTGNPTDLETLRRCVPSVSEILFRNC